MRPVFGAWCRTLVNRQRLNIARSKINLFTSPPIALTAAPLPSQTGKTEAIRTLIVMSTSPLPSRASSLAYSDFELDDAQADFATAFALQDQPGLAGPVESITPRDVDDLAATEGTQEQPIVLDDSDSDQGGGEDEDDGFVDIDDVIPDSPSAIAMARRTGSQPRLETQDMFFNDPGVKALIKATDS
jgi:hypothetical protein